MNVSEVFIRRPVGTSLLMIGVAVAGVAAYNQLPVSALPQVDYPTIVVSTILPGASADTMVSAVTTPLERQLGQIPSLAHLTSVSSAASSQITLQFTLDREIDSAEQDVQAAINAASNLLPETLPTPPTYSKSNPADVPVISLAVRSDTSPLSVVDDYADSILAQKLSQVSGVGLVTLNGGQRPAVRVQVDPVALAGRGLGLEDVRAVLALANVNQPKGNLDGPRQNYLVSANDQLASAEGYKPLVIAYQNGAPVRLTDVAKVLDGVENAQLAGWANEHTAVILNVQRQPGANLIEVAERVKTLLPRLEASLPQGIKVEVLSDRTETVRASVRDVEFTLVLTMILVVAVIYLFLRTLRATIIPGIAVPLSLIATFGIMLFLGYSLNNLTLMALTISTGFVVDDAIVMIENIARHIEEGDPPFTAALKGSKQIGFTIVSLTVSLVAVLIPLLFMGGIIGRLFREFAVTLSDGHRRLGDHLADADRDDVRPHPPPHPQGRRGAGGARLGGGVRLDGEDLRPRARLGPQPPGAHAGRHHRHRGAHLLPGGGHPQGALPPAGHRDAAGNHRGAHRRLVPGDDDSPTKSRGRHPRRPRRRQRRLLHRRRRDQPHPLDGPPLDHAQEPRPPQGRRAGDHRSPQQQARSADGRHRLPAGGAGPPALEPGEPHAVPVHHRGRRPEGARDLGATDPRSDEEASPAGRRGQRSAGRRAADTRLAVPWRNEDHVPRATSTSGAPLNGRSVKSV